METKDLVQQGNTLRLNIMITRRNIQQVLLEQTPEFHISNSAKFDMKVYYCWAFNYLLIFIRFVKLHQDDNLRYAIKFSSLNMGITNKSFINDDGTWHLVYEITSPYHFTYDVNVYMDILPSVSSFSTLHDDSELTDFELRGEHGSVHMHKAVLAASSPVLRKMLSGTWREATEGCVNLPGTSKTTLQHLKDYVYLHTLPEAGLEQLLLLSCYYMMPDLEQKCVDKLVKELTSKNTYDLLVFAVEHKMPKLLLAILKCIQLGTIKVHDMYDYVLRKDTLCEDTLPTK